MKKIVLYTLWLILYVLCAILSHFAEPSTQQAAAITLISLLFFVPGVLLLIDGLRTQNKKGVLLLRWISGSSLALSVVMLVVNILSALSSDAVGVVLYELLIFVSVPMIASQHWLLSLFLWSMLFFATFLDRKKS